MSSAPGRPFAAGSRRARPQAGARLGTIAIASHRLLSTAARPRFGLMRNARGAPAAPIQPRRRGQADTIEGLLFIRSHRLQRLCQPGAQRPIRLLREDQRRRDFRIAPAWPSGNSGTATGARAHRVRRLRLRGSTYDVPFTSIRRARLPGRIRADGVGLNRHWGPVVVGQS
jgi:hypothetical protein